MSKEPHVSVVTPAYNAASFIEECRASVVSQSYSAWDWTIVDNLSTDGTYELATEFARDDPRIRVIRNERFLNAEENHNEALRQVSDAAKYCKVVGADDLLFPECLRRMVAVAEAHSRVAIVGAYAIKGNQVAYDGVPFPEVLVDGREACRDLLMGGPFVFGCPSSVLYRADIVRSRHSFYNEANTHSDTEVCFEFLADADFGFVHQVLCYLRLRDESERSKSQRLNTYIYGDLLALLRYGRQYLTEPEWESMVRLKVRRYRQFMGMNALRRREAEFWDYHLAKLDELGYPMSRFQIFRASVEFVLFRLPVELTRRLRAGVRG